MKLLALIFFIATCSLAYGQTNINDLERNEGLWTKKGEATPFTGGFVEYYESGKLKGNGNFKNGLVDGSRITFYENGNKRTELNYLGGLSNGRSIEYYENGKIKQEGEFKNGKEEGIWKVYNENGNLYVLLTFSGGVQNGDYFEYSPEGKVKVQYYFVDGKASYSPEYLELVKQALQLSRQFKNDEAIKLYDKAIELNPTVAQCYFNRGACKGNIFDFEGAIKDYDKAIELNPQYMEAFGNRGNAKINMYTSKGNLNPTPTETESACMDLNKAVLLGDKTIGTEDMIFLYCKKSKKRTN